MFVLDEKIGKAYKLDGNELCVYSHIDKYKENGWFSTYPRMAELLPIVVSIKTIERTVKKLTALGLIERRNGVLFTTTNCPLPTDILSLSDRQNVLPKQTNCLSRTDKLSSIYNKENKKREEENTLACDSIATPIPSTPSSFDKNLSSNQPSSTEQPLSSFDQLLNAYKSHNGDINLSAAKLSACRELWNNKSPLEKQKLLQALNNDKWFKDTLEWTISDFRLPQPRNYNGDMTVDINSLAKSIPMVFAIYNDVGGIYTQQDAIDYQMIIRKDFIPDH